MSVSIKSLPFSFVRFEPVTEDYCPGEASYKLPAYLNHEVKFQFLVEGDLSEDEKIRLGIEGTPFDPPVYADLIDYKYKVTLPFSFTGSIYLDSITFLVTKTYGYVVTIAQFLAILENDFGIVAQVLDGYLYFVNACKLDLEIKAGPTDAGSVVTINEVEYLWNQGYIEAPDIEITLAFDVEPPDPVPPEYLRHKGCFNYTLHQDIEGAPVLGQSNEFHTIPDDCFTSLLTYSCNEDAFDFSYQNGRVNQIRLPFYLSRPNWPTKRSVYIKSSGVHKVLNAFVEKEYLLQADWMIELFHECMAIALAHDTIVIGNDNIREKEVEVVSSDAYTADWNSEHELLIAPAKCKILAAKFGRTNSNCDTEDTDCDCEAVAFLTDPVTFPAGQSGVAYDYTFQINGTPPFELADVNVPEWMTLAILPGVTGTATISATGTPLEGDIGEGITVAFKIKNCVGENFIEVNQLINVTA